MNTINSHNKELSKQLEIAPMMYNGHLIKLARGREEGKFFLCAYDFNTDTFLNPLYSTWEALKSVIDELKDNTN